MHHYGYKLNEVLELPWCQFISLTRAANPEELNKKDETANHTALAKKMHERREQRQRDEDPGIPVG